MAESIKKYLREHHWGIVQGISGVYCAAFATWDRLHPLPTTQPSRVGSSMTQSYTMPFWLWVGIVVLALSVAVPAIIRLARKRQQSTLFTPLQLEAFVLARNLRQLVEHFPPPSKADYGYDEQRDNFSTKEQIFAFAEARSAVEERLRADYVLKFQAKAIELYHRFVQAGVHDRHLGVLADVTRKQDDVTDLIATLRADALKVEDAQL